MNVTSIPIPVAVPVPLPVASPWIDKHILATVGLLLAITGNVILSVGLNLQKLAHSQMQQADQYLHSKLWWFGFITMIVGECGNFAAYGFAPATLVAPLGAVGVIANMVVAHFLRKEYIRLRDFFGSVLIVIGGVMLVLASPQEEIILDIKELMTYIFSPVFEIYSGVLLLVFIGLLLIGKKMARRNVVVDLLLCAIVGSVTVMGTKGFSTSIRLTIAGTENAFLSPVTYILGVIIIITALLQVRFLNESMRNFGTSQVVPIYYVLFTLATILGGIVLYHEFQALVLTNEVTFFVGLVITFIGVHLVNADRDEDSQNSRYDDEAEEFSLFGGLKESQRLEGILLGGGFGLAIGLIFSPAFFSLFILPATLVGIGIGGLASSWYGGLEEEMSPLNGPKMNSDSSSYSLFV